MKKISFLLLSILISVLSFGQNAWEQQFQADILVDQLDGQSVAIDITNRGKNVDECKFMARQQAMYAVLFMDLPKSSTSSGSEPITKIATYNQNVDFFKSYLLNETEGLMFCKNANINTQKPGSKIDKKTIEITTTVYVQKGPLRDDLEKRGIIKSASSVAEALGYKPTIFVVPSDGWMNVMGYMKKINQNGEIVERPDYLKAYNNEIFTSIDGFITSRFGGPDGAFEIKSLKAVVDQLATEDAADNMSSKYGKKQESDNDRLARSAQADVWLQVHIVEGQGETNQETKFQLTFTAIDPYTGEKVFSTEPASKTSLSRDKLGIIESLTNAACDKFQPQVLSFLVQRESKGLPGYLTFISKVESVDFKLTKVEIPGKGSFTLEKVLPGIASKKAGKGAKQQGVINETEMKFQVTIPTKVVDPISDMTIPNNFTIFAQDVISEIEKYGGNYSVITEVIGAGNVRVVFIEKQ